MIQNNEENLKKLIENVIRKSIEIYNSKNIDLSTGILEIRTIVSSVGENENVVLDFVTTEIIKSDKWYIEEMMYGHEEFNEESIEPFEKFYEKIETD